MKCELVEFSVLKLFALLSPWRFPACAICASDKNCCHLQISVASTQGLFQPPTGNPASTNSPRPKPFWKQLMLLGACYIALFNVGQGTVKFVPYIPPVPKKDGRAKNKGCAHRARRTFLQKARIIENYLDAKTANPALSQDQFGLDYGLSQGTLSKWLQKSEFIFIQARHERLSKLFSVQTYGSS